MKLPFVFGILFFFNVLIKGGQLTQNLRSIFNGVTRDVSLGLDIPCGMKSGGDNRIINGEIAGKHEFPWIISLQVKGPKSSFTHICGGSVIHPLWIVTAGHCLIKKPIDNYRIVAGAFNLDIQEPTQQIRSVVFVNTSFIGHSNFNADDIALMKVDKEFDLDGRTVLPICLPDKSDKGYSGPITQAGWGKTTVYHRAKSATEALRKVTTHTLPLKECQKKYNEYGVKLNECQVCRWSPYDKGTCKGDSGGPGMYVKDGKSYLWGVVSFAGRCASTLFPGINADVTCYDDWIVDTINNN